MTINISRRFRNSPGVLVPQNRGMGEIAQRKIEHEVGRANRQYLEAARTDGYQLRIWDRTSGSVRCTCNKVRAAEPPLGARPSSAADNYDERVGDNPRDSLDYERTFQTTTPLGPFTLRDSRKADYEDGIIPNTPNDLPEFNPDEDEFQEEFLGGDFDIDTDEPADEDAQRRQLGAMHRAILGVDKYRCPICFGTGYVDAYLFLSGRRYVLDASEQYPFTLQAVTINTREAPNHFEIADLSAEAIWTVEFPAWFETVSSVRLFNNFELAQRLKITYREHGTSDEWQKFDANVLNQRKGQASKLDIRVSLSEKVINGIETFTHIEILYEYVPLPLGQIPQLNRATALFSREDILSVECEVEPTVGYVHKESVMELALDGTIWRIGNVTNNRTSKNQLFGYRMEITLVQSSEQISLLRVRNPENIDHTRSTYRGLERVQGKP